MPPSVLCDIEAGETSDSPGRLSSGSGVSFLPTFVEEGVEENISLRPGSSKGRKVDSLQLSRFYSVLVERSRPRPRPPRSAPVSVRSHAWSHQVAPPVSAPMSPTSSPPASPHPTEANNASSTPTPHGSTTRDTTTPLVGLSERQQVKSPTTKGKGHYKQGWTFFQITGQEYRNRKGKDVNTVKAST